MKTLYLDIGTNGTKRSQSRLLLNTSVCVFECDLVSVRVVGVFRGQGRHHGRLSLTLDVHRQQHRLKREREK